MDLPFPADVSLRVEGELADAQPLFPVSRTILNRALAMQATGVPVVRLFVPLPGVGLVSAFISGDIKHLYVEPTKRVPPAKPEPENEPGMAPVQETFVPSMLSGVVKRNGGTFDGPAVVEILHSPNPSTFELREFNPSGTSVDVYGLDIGWQDSEKLGVTNAGTIGETGPAISAYPKPSMFSGAMKRFYQALLGLGLVRDVAQEEYISGAMPTTDPDVIVFPQFAWRWDRTHGICFQGGTVWLIEINKDEGVLAMPVPLFAETMSPSFSAWLQAIGDTEGGDVVAEFGGIPTGEAFPTGTTLTDALAAGKVVRIMDAATLEPAYHDADLTLDKQALADDIGWAFSESGTTAALTTFYYKDIDKARTALKLTSDPDPQVGMDYTADERFMLSEHWHITIAGLAIDPTTALPVTTATAALELIESTHVWGSFNRFRDNEYLINSSKPPLAWRVNLWVPVSPHQNEETLESFNRFGWNLGVHPTPNPGEGPAYYDVWPDHGPIMFSFFVGEREELVRQYQVNWGSPFPFTAPMILDDVGFYGDSAGFTTSYFYGATNLIIPKYSREGYILLAMTSDTDMNAIGYFDDAGLISFATEIGIDNTTYLYRVCTYKDINFPYDSPAVGTPVQPYCGAVLNAAINGGFLMTNRCHFDDWPNIAFPDVDRSYVQSDSISYYAIPTDTTPKQMNFVGAP